MRKTILLVAAAFLSAATPGFAASVPPPDDVAAPPDDAEKTASGLVSKVLKPGKGTTHPAKTDVVTVHYTGWTTDGKSFDSSVARGKPASFPLDKVIPGWTEGVQLMVAGEKRRFWIPEKLAYKGKEGRPAGMLVFDVELISFKAPAAKEVSSDPTKAPDDVQRPPDDAKRTASGRMRGASVITSLPLSTMTSHTIVFCKSRSREMNWSTTNMSRKPLPR